jgi:hypothetical protein
MMPLARACAAAGHEVTVAIGEPFLGRLPLPTVRGVPGGVDLDWVVRETKHRHPEVEGYELSVAMFGDTTADLISASLPGGRGAEPGGLRDRTLGRRSVGRRRPGG